MTAHDGKWTAPDSRDMPSSTRGGEGGIGGDTGWLRWMPGLRTLLRYEAAWLGHDVMAGLVLATMLVPVGIAYAVASGLPGICGLYATIVPLLVYAVFGPSRILVLGPVLRQARQCNCTSPCEVKEATGHHIDRFCNPVRHHSRFDYVSPAQFERMAGQMPNRSPSN